MTAEFSFTITPITQHDFMWITFFGEPTLKELLKSFRDFRAHPDYQPYTDVLMDWTDSSLAKLSSDDISRLSYYLSQEKDRHNIKQASVVSTKLDFGLLRMFDLRSDESAPQQRRLFHSVHEALEWLRPSVSFDFVTGADNSESPNS